MKKYALIITANTAYIPGANALLNGLDYYGYKDLDVHFLYGDGMQDYLEKIKGAFDFDVIPVDAQKLASDKCHMYANYQLVKYKYAATSLKDYKAVMHIDADCVILANFSKYFQIAADTGLIPCGLFPHTPVSIEEYPLAKDAERVDWINCSYPLANFPIFYDPLRHADFMAYVWDNIPVYTNSDPLRNHEIYVFNKAAYETNKIKDILPLPGSTWVGDSYNAERTLTSGTVAGKLAVFNYVQDRMMIIHNKWWKPGMLEGEVSRLKAGNVSESALSRQLHNIDVIKRALTVFNQGWKVKI